MSKRPLPLPDPDLSDFTCTPEQQFWGDVEVLILMSLVVAVILLALILPWKGVLQCR